jgi:hypothetical protein
MFDYDYDIIYRKGKYNVVDDALSSKYEEDGSLFSLAFIVANWLNLVHHQFFQDSKIASLIQKVEHESNAFPRYTWENEDLCYKGCLYLIKYSNFKSIVLSKLHASPTIENSSFHKINKPVSTPNGPVRSVLLSHIFPSLRSMVKSF